MSNEGHSIHDQMAQRSESVAMLPRSNTDIVGEYPGVSGSPQSAGVPNRSWEICERIRGKTIDGTKAAASAFYQNAFQTISVGIGISALIGYFLALRFVCDRI